MALSDKVTFMILKKFCIDESEVKKIMKRELKKGSYRLGENGSLEEG